VRDGISGREREKNLKDPWVLERPRGLFPFAPVTTSLLPPRAVPLNGAFFGEGLQLYPEK